jgi:DNA-binding XRE family transcriptional regulator
MTSLNKALKYIRLFDRLNQTELSKALNISKSVISEIESGKRLPSTNIIKSYSDYFNIPISEIYFLSEKIGNKNKTSFLSKRIINLIDWVVSDNDSVVTDKTNSSPTGKLKMER